MPKILKKVPNICPKIWGNLDVEDSKYNECSKILFDDITILRIWLLNNANIN